MTHLDAAAAGGWQGWTGEPADHRVDGVHPGLQLLHVRGLEQVLRSITGLQSTIINSYKNSFSVHMRAFKPR